VRQLLTTLTEALSRCSDAEKQNSAQSLALKTLYPVLFNCGDHYRGKPALQILANLISKDFVSLDKLWTSATSWLEGQNDLFSSQSNEKQIVLRRFFDWLAYQDTAPAAGNLVLIIIKKNYTITTVESVGSNSNQLPIWAEPLEASITAHRSEIRSYKEYAFPGIFKLSMADFYVFLAHLGLLNVLVPEKESLPLKDDSDMNETRKSILFSALHTGKELGIIEEVGKTP
jgi:hypothetical protein